MNTILLAPTFMPEQGIGHIIRSITLLEKLGHNTYLYIPDNILISKELASFLPKHNIIRSLKNHNGWDIIILDRRGTSKNELKKFSLSRTIIGLDEGGKSRHYVPYLIDSPLNPLQKIKPNNTMNLTQNIYIKNGEPLETRQGQNHDSILKVLVSFGGEDINGLSVRLASFLIRKQIFTPESITIVEGPLFKQKNWPSGVTIIKNPGNVSGLLPEYDLLFTHFGITCFESIVRYVPVILFNPSEYHQKLGAYYKFPSLGVQKPNIRRLKKLLADPESLYNSIFPIQQAIRNRSFISGIIQSLHIKGTYTCPGCGKNQNPVIERFIFRSYFLCRKCHLIYSQVFNSKQETYDKNYFFREYKEQYGKTYIEDFNNIKEHAHRRLSLIKTIPGNSKVLLDIGCAYGPFLLAAKEEGFIPEGMDISRDACSYVTKTLHIPCTRIDFSMITDKKSKERKYDIITMWYVLEHFIQTDVVLNKVNKYLKRGGIFAFSTPNISGISFKKNRKKYLDASPEDHYTLWNPHIAGKILSLYGFRIKKIRITGHHPERFPLLHNKKKGILFSLVLIVSKVFRLGDTFEVYAQKIKEVL